MPHARRSPLLRSLCLLLALCFFWSFAAAPCAVAAGAARKARPMARRFASPAERLANTPYAPSFSVTCPHSTGGQTAPAVAAPPLTLLNEVGHRGGAVPAAQVAAWRRELRTTRTASTRAARLQLWLGECALAQDRQPALARWHFRQAQRLTPRTNPAHGLAAYDAAMALFYEGAYQEATDAFGGLLRPRTAAAGYDPRSVSLWRRHAAACAGYHADHAALGVPEPPRLDPECGIASLAACLRALGRPSDRRSLRAACRVTGEGSTLDDLLASGGRLGVSVRAVAADELGLRALPKPAVAFVERDHFVAVVRADAAGVSYLCSDCGMWPGGRVDLTWKQWRALSPGVYAVVTAPGGVPDRAMAAITASAGAPLRLSYGGALSGLRLSSRLRVLTAGLPMRGHVFRYGNTQWLGCGFGISSLHCSPQCCPKDSRQAGSPSDPGTTGGGGGLQAAAVGPSAGDPVNLATGEEEYTPAPDLSVYNPTGPSVSWSRVYNSMRPYTYATYQSTDFGTGWSQPFNVLFNGPPATGSILQLKQGAAYGPVNGVGHDAPAAGCTWDVLLNGSSVATSAAPSGWAFTSSAYSGTLTPPASAQVTTGYEVRWVAANYPTSGTNTDYSSPFDVVPAASVVQGGSASFAATGQDAPASSLTWDVVQGGATVASSASPNGWTVSAGSGGGPASVSVSTQGPVAVGSFEARVRYSTYPSGTAYASASFTSYAAHTTYGGGGGSLVEPNGAIMAFTAPSAPTAGNPVVACSVPPGYACTVEWDYAPGYYSGRFVVTWADRTKWVTTPYANYRSSGYLLGQIVDRNGNAINLQYYTPGGYFLLLSGVADSAGNPLLTVARNGGGAITSVSDRYGRSVYYGTDTGGSGALGQVSQVVPTGTGSALTQYNRYTYGYASVTNPENEGGFYLLHTIQAPSPAGTGTSTSTINYANGTFAVTSLVDGNGNTRTYTQVNADGSAATDGPTSYTKVAVTNPGGAAVYSYVAAFDGNMSETSRTDGATNAQGQYTDHVTQKAYADANDPYRPSSVTDGNGNVTKMVWDQYGNLHQETSPRGTVTNFTYGFPAATYPGVAGVVNTQQKSDAFALGELLSMQEGSKEATGYAYYEPSGLLHTLTTPTPGTAGGTTTVATSWTYDGLGNVLTETRPGNNATVTGGVDHGITTTFGYTADGGYSQSDALGQPLTSTDNLGKVTHFRYDGRGNRLSVVDALGNETDFTYNVAGQPLATIDPATGQTGTGHASQVTAYLYPGGPVTGALAYDEGNTAGPIRQVAYAYGPEGETRGVSGSTEPVTYAYDAQYRLTGLTDGGGHITHYYYKAQGYLDAVTYPGYSGPTPAYNAASDGYTNVTGADSLRFPTYDIDGNVTSRVDGNGVTTTYTHSADPESLLTNVHYAYPSGYAGTQIADVSLSYDGYGRRVGMTDGTGSQSYAYDDLDAPLTVSTAYAGLPSRSMTYGYWPDGSRQTLGTPAGSFSYTYDADGRMTGLINPYSEASAWSYLDNGWLWKRTLANGVVTAHTYNALGETTDLQTKTSAGTVLSDFSAQAYDGIRNRTALTASLPGAAGGFSGQTAYQYDSGQTGAAARSQITGEQSTRGGGFNLASAYDGGTSTGPGNPTTLRGAAHSFNADNQDAANAYDGDGSPTTYRGTAMKYDPEARLTQVGTADTDTYTGDGLRAEKRFGSAYYYYLYDGDEPVVELNGSGVAAQVHTFGADGLVSRRFGGATIFYTFDPSGNVAQRLDSGGNVGTSDLYDGFGATVAGGGGGDVFGFGGQWGCYTDAQTGLVLCTHRFYDAGAGRFLTRDPAGYAGGIDLYGYTGNNPVNRGDPSGYQSAPPVTAPGAPAPPVTAPPTVPLPGEPVTGGGGGVGIGVGVGTIACSVVLFFMACGPAGGPGDTTQPEPQPGSGGEPPRQDDCEVHCYLEQEHAMPGLSGGRFTCEYICKNLDTGEAFRRIIPIKGGNSCPDELERDPGPHTEPPDTVPTGM